MPDCIYVRLELILDCPSVTTEMKESFKEWAGVWSGRANIMPLPMGGLDDSLNLLKGSSTGDYHDFSDSFYSEFLKDSEGNLAWVYTSGNNPSYFSKFGNITGADVTDSYRKSYVEKNYLQDLFLYSDYKSFQQIGPCKKVQLPYNSNDTSAMSDAAKMEARDYIVNTFLPAANEFIKNRVKRLADLTL